MRSGVDRNSSAVSALISILVTQVVELAEVLPFVLDEIQDEQPVPPSQDQEGGTAGRGRA